MTRKQPKLTAAGVEIAQRVRAEIDRVLVDTTARLAELRSEIESRLDEIDARLDETAARVSDLERHT